MSLLTYFQPEKAMVCKYRITLNNQHYALKILLLNSSYNIPTRWYLSFLSPPSVCLIDRLSPLLQHHGNTIVPQSTLYFIQYTVFISLLETPPLCIWLFRPTLQSIKYTLCVIIQISYILHSSSFTGTVIVQKLHHIMLKT